MVTVLLYSDSGMCPVGPAERKAWTPVSNLADLKVRVEKALAQGGELEPIVVLIDLASSGDARDYLKDLKFSIGSHIVLVGLSNKAEKAGIGPASVGLDDYVADSTDAAEIRLRIDSALAKNKAVANASAERKEWSETLRDYADLNRKLRQISLVDGLTGIYNRRFFDQSLEQAWRISARDRQPMSVLLFDVDHFKAFNDFYGHIAGDEALIKIAQCGAACLCRPSDSIARYGGEEFGVVLPSTDLDGAMFIAERIKTAIFAMNLAHERSATSDRVTVSIGISCMLGEISLSAKAILSSADTALYRAKEGGRNLCHAFGED